MFKDTKTGQTHFENDGCGEPAHNKLDWRERLKPKVLVYRLTDEPLREAVLVLLNEYWKHLEPGIAEVEKLAEERGRMIEAKKWSERTGKTLHEASKLIRSSLKAELIEKLEGKKNNSKPGEEHWDGGNFDDSYSYGVQIGENYGLSTAIEILKGME